MDRPRLIFFICLSSINSLLMFFYHHFFDINQNSTFLDTLYSLAIIIAFFAILSIFSLEKKYNVDGAEWYFFGRFRAVMSSLFIIGLVNVIDFYFSCNISLNLRLCAEKAISNNYLFDIILLITNLILIKFFDWWFKSSVANSVSITMASPRDPDESTKG